MKNCQICGQPSGIYDICRECQKDVENNKVSICSNCGNYYITGSICDCLKGKNKQSEDPNINIEVNNEVQKEGFGSGVSKGFGQGCGCLLFIIAFIIVIVIIAGGL